MSTKKDQEEKEPTVEEVLTSALKAEKHARAQLQLDNTDSLQLAQIIRNYAGQLSPRIQSILASNIIGILSPKPPK